MRKNGVEGKRMEVALSVHLLIEFSLMDQVNVFYIKNKKTLFSTSSGLKSKREKKKERNDCIRELKQLWQNGDK